MRAALLAVALTLPAAGIVNGSGGVTAGVAGTQPDGGAGEARNHSEGPRQQTIVPKYHSFMGESHQDYERSGDPGVKMLGDSARRFGMMNGTLNKTENVWVWTQGEEATYRPASSEQASHNVTFQGRTSSRKERNRISDIAEIDWHSPIRPFVSVVVDNRSQIERLAALEFVYLIELQTAPVGATASPYQADWIRQQQKVDQAKSSRDAWDGGGNGAMPDSVNFHVIDTGYDSSETKFNEPYAESQIHAHGHDWTSHANGIGGSENNEHGTLVADVMDLMNYGGGTYIIHQVDSWSDIRQALEDIQINHPGADVITMSYVVLYNNWVCHDDYDDILSDLMQTQDTVLSVSVGNHDQTVTISYPASSTWAFGVGGAEDGIWDWPTPSGAKHGTISLDSGECPLQFDYHANRDGATSLFKPDVYGFYYIDTDNDGRWYGASFATPEIASGLGTIESRYYLGKDSTFIPWKQWDSLGTCWEGAYPLVIGSAAPDGREVTPTSASQLGDMADHDAWFQDSWTC